ncbi:MAG: tRNA 2-thiouridine(34) synthase MnmA [Paludibacteraceae bacterium]|nr:tRNA 2-thiouridine(34) synthase MnmA [Paludibacteraceae bacterium]
MSKRVLIGMSGGIDSTVAAILLLEQGYELVGATFRTFDPTPIANTHPSLGGDGSRLHCASEQSIMDAQRMAATLGFEHHILDFRNTFREHVIGNFVSEYARGRTPNPCVLCNSHIKWGKLMQAAEQYGCDYIATGHYAQIAEHRGHMYLKTAVDTHKDQTYFLWMLTEENLRHTIFPLGGLTKTEVRQIAFDHGFETLSKKAESQDICFIPNNDYRSFLAQHGVSVPQGEYVDAQGKILGMHQGYCHYTIGQRKGLGIALGAPKFVTKIDAENNRVTLGDRDDLLTTQATIADVRIRDWDWLKESPHVQARIRYKSPAIPARLLPIANTQLPIANTPTLSEGASVHFVSPVWGVTPGQSLVMYKDNLVVGGSIIQ